MSDPTTTASVNTEEKKEMPTYHFNINHVVDKQHEKKFLTDIIKLPPSALQGMAEKADAVLKKYGITTIEDMGNWKFYKAAVALKMLSQFEEIGRRDESCMMNINAILMKEYETKSLAEIMQAPLNSLQGLAGWQDDFKIAGNAKLATVEQLANCKYFGWAEAIVGLSAFENRDHSSR